MSTDWLIKSGQVQALNVQLLNVYHVISWYLCSLCLNFFHLLARKANWKKNYIYSNKFFHDFHLAESSFTCPRLRISGLAWRLSVIVNMYMYCLNLYLPFGQVGEKNSGKDCTDISWSHDIHSEVEHLIVFDGKMV
jgi:hypothetical protein